MSNINLIFSNAIANIKVIIAELPVIHLCTVLSSA